MQLSFITYTRSHKIVGLNIVLRSQFGTLFHYFIQFVDVTLGAAEPFVLFKLLLIPVGRIGPFLVSERLFLNLGVNHFLIIINDGASQLT